MTAVGDKYGPYTCVRRIGEGGMAETFLAIQSGPYGFEQRVCIKLIREDCKGHRKFVEMFFHEATIAASLRHSNIVSVIDSSQKDGYMVLELVDGVDLRTLLQATPRKTLAPEEVIYIALELVKALDFAHNRRLHGKPDGIVHRDIKPSNILVSYAGEVKLADFGIAKAIRSTLDTDGLIRGTPYYMSPEQINRQPLDPRSDLFSLGVVLYELLSGQHPFLGSNDGETVERIGQGRFASLSEVAYSVPAGLAVVVERLLERDPDRRFESAQALAEALDRFAPAPSIYRKLGYLARNARPPETLMPMDVTGAPALLLPIDGRQSEKQINLAVSISGASARIGNHNPDREPIPAGPSQPTRTLRQTRSPLSLTLPLVSMGTRLWRLGMPRKRLRLIGAITLAAALCALLVTLYYLPKRGDKSSKSLINAKTTAPPVPSSSSTTKKDKALTDVRSEFDHTLDMRSDLAADPRFVTSREQASAETEASSKPISAIETAVKRPEKELLEGQGQGIVRVGVFPWGKVWIDEQFLGTAPVSVDLSAGKHVVAGGIQRPLVSKTIKLKAGTEQQVVINLRDREP
ncbi:MAG: serine/threonine protein kinase [Deltaproteobacteria bacterium]|nr:serine/threonine protein kinase [Deltaproteobacteria bacterium]